MSSAEWQPILPAELWPEWLVMWGIGVWNEISFLIHPTGVLWDSGPFLESYCPQTIPSQTLFSWWLLEKGSAA
jgi:hypothetical protein